MSEAAFMFAMFSAVIGVVVPLAISVWILKTADHIARERDKKNSQINVDLLNALLSDKTVENIDTMVDGFISNAGDMYTLLKLSQNQTHYISEEIKNEMTSYIFGTVKKNMTPTVRQIIGLIHNVDEEEELDKYLDLRIKMYVLNYMVNYNQLQEESI